ncbi:hypothetical protein BN134_3366 [Cronobacter dublinensis 1210]|uniref:Uncharacterized protein n=1 Tax=Cronobacter dublinensis 1210 TaxID=1208656 RepID=A0ABP1WDG3_9ENTR|nr:hypothetical protein BN134_3366 [Cronobacter dublinensis 1210]CCJ87757.1 hypothetical protein BN133_4134 [Cronobacter dublinensis 582]
MKENLPLYDGKFLPNSIHYVIKHGWKVKLPELMSYFE